MTTKVIKVNPQVEPSALEAQLSEAAKALAEGALVVFPTETVYGLGCNPFHKGAVRRLFEIKGRPKDRPLILHLANQEQGWELAAEVPDAARKLAEAFWAGPLTLVLPKAPHVPKEVCGGGETVGMRMPDHPVALCLIRLVGIPIAAPSANLTGQPSPKTAEEVLAQLEGRIDWLIDSGRTPLGVESTVLDLTTEPPVILRQGSLPKERIEAVLGRPVK